MDAFGKIERFRVSYTAWCERAFSSAPDRSFAEPHQLERSGLSPGSIEGLESALDCKLPKDFEHFLRTTKASSWLLPPNIILMQFDGSFGQPPSFGVAPRLFPVGLLENQGITLGFDKVDRTQPSLPIHAEDERGEVTKAVCSSFSDLLAALALLMERLDPLQPNLVGSSLIAELKALDPTGIGAAGAPLWSRVLERRARPSR